MRSRIVTCTTTMALSFAPLALPLRLAGQEQTQHYRAINLGNLSGTAGEGNTINNIGWAIGAADLAGNTTEHATLWIYGLRFDLGTLGGPNSNVQWPNKNDHGLVAGFSETADLNPLNESWSCTAFIPTFATGHDCVGFVWQFGVMIALPTLGGFDGFAAGNNNLGQIVGWAETTVHDATCVAPPVGTQVLQFLPVVYGPGVGQIQQLPTFVSNGLPDPDGAATAINDNGQIVGISGTCDVAVGAFTATHALLWQNGTITNLGSLGGQGWNTPMAINKRGDIVGFSDLAGDVSGGTLNANFHAFIWTKESGKMTDIGVLPGDSISEALDINDQGQVVGVSFPSGHAFIYENNKIRDLNSLLPKDSPLLLLFAGGINDRGEITGEACVIANGACTTDQPAFLAIPDGDFKADALAEDAYNETARITVPESVHQRVMRKLAFGHFASEPKRSQ